MKVLLITPPFTQLNTPYPATAYLKALLDREGYDTRQIDLGNLTIRTLFSREGLEKIYKDLEENHNVGDFTDLERFFALKSRYLETVEPVVSFLTGQNDEAAYRINSGTWLPEGERQEYERENENESLTDRARHKATLYLEEIGDIITAHCDPSFGFSRYAERIALSPPHFDDMNESLKSHSSPVSEIFLSKLEEILKQYQPDLCALTVPFPGNLFSALLIGRFIKAGFKHIKIAMGGGYVNTELRELSDPRLFDYVDYITLDDGERPLLQLCNFLSGKEGKETLLRTFLIGGNGTVEYLSGTAKDFSLQELPAPDYSGLMDQPYLSLLPVTNKMHRLWSSGKWNKMTLAHGCYWHRCAFCDTSLDYICRYESQKAAVIADKMEKMIAQTGIRAFHFVDEAAPPALLKDLAIELIRRDLQISWWTNIRFEKSFTADLCRLLAKSGCIAVSGGLEVASNRMLELMDKGVSVDQVASVTAAFSYGGIMVHAYLMYGFPGQSEQEIIDALENVRQLFKAELLDSAFWHQFALTAHSPVGLSPDKFGVEISGPEKGSFARNDLEYRENRNYDPSNYSAGLKSALQAYMKGWGFDNPVHRWFDFKTPKASVSKNYIKKLLNNGALTKNISGKTRLLWTGTDPLFKEGYIELHDIDGAERVKTGKREANFLSELLKICHIENSTAVTVDDVEILGKNHNLDFDEFLSSPLLTQISAYGLLFI